MANASRSKRRIKVKTPAGRRTIHYRVRKTSRATCSGCKAFLHGVSHARGLAASKRNPTRPYGGVLCTKCTRLTIKSTLVRGK